MDINKLTSQFQQDLASAQSLAVRNDHSVIEPLHLLKTMTDNTGSSVSQILLQSGVNVAKLAEELSEAIQSLGKINNPNGDVMPLSLIHI